MNRNIAVVGSGYWGKNLVRVIHELGALNMVCDRRHETTPRPSTASAPLRRSRTY